MKKDEFDPRKYVPTILDMLKYDMDKSKDDTICKDMGDYLQMIVPMDNEKGHDTYNVYVDEDGHMTRVEGHKDNSGFTGTIRF